jgi:DNA polymerase III subunit epsilon
MKTLTNLLAQVKSLATFSAEITNWQDDIFQTRWVVADVETSGLNIHRDRLIAIGAVAVEHGVVKLSDSFEVVLQQPRISTNANILIHRISGETQMKGEPAATALTNFLDFVGDSPLVGYHAKFDEIMLARAVKQHLGTLVNRTWLDLAALAPALVPEGQLDRMAIAQGQRTRPLDWWLNRYQIHITHRHHAACDALASAQLMVALLHLTTPMPAKALLTLAEDFAWTVNQRRF